MEIELKPGEKPSVNLGNGKTPNLMPDATKDEKGNRTVTLPSGKVAVIAPFKGKHVREAQTIAGGDASKLLFAIIALSVSIDEKPVLLEDLDEMDGLDVITLYGQFGQNFIAAPNK